jgi:hypothetical protein
VWLQPSAVGPLPLRLSFPHRRALSPTNLWTASPLPLHSGHFLRRGRGMKIVPRLALIRMRVA